MQPRYTLSDLQARLGGHIQGDGGVVLTNIASLEHAGPGSLSFVTGGRHVEAAVASRAAALIAPAGLEDRLPQPLLEVANPHAVFARAVTLFHPEPPAPPGIHPSAVIAATARIDADVSLGAHVVVGAGARIGARTRVGAGCVIGDEVEIGTDGCFFPNVTVYAGCRLGERVILHAGCVIGADGFGLAWEENGWLKVPQVGRVVLGNDVEIGANSTIDRGALDDTVIGDGVKIDNLVQIAHNCIIGDQTAIAGCAGIAGSTKIGRRCLIGGAAMILGHIEIGDGVTVSGASFIGKSIRDAGVYTSTQPQMPHDEWLRNAAQLRHLAAMRERIRALEKQLSTKGKA